MNTKLTNTFPNGITFTKECFVADYSNDQNPAVAKNGVVISLIPIPEIESFQIKKLRDDDNVPVFAINFEKHPAFSHSIQCCECCFSPLIDKDNGWVMFLEMKYCKPENAEIYAAEAYHQMRGALDKMLDLDLVDKKRQQIYFVFSVPKSTASIPFSSFLTTPGSTITIEKTEGIHLLGANSVIIATPQFLKIPKMRI